MANGKFSGQAKETGGKTLRERLLFPPLLFLPLFLVAMLLRDPYRAGEITGPLTASLIAVYAALSIAYLTLNKKGLPKAANAAAAMANGVLLMFFSCGMGTGPVFGWAGLGLFLIGLVQGLRQLTPPPAARFAKTNQNILPPNIAPSDVRRILKAIVLPSAFLEFDDTGEERVMAVNEPFATALGKSADKLQGAAFDTLLPAHEDGTVFRFADLEWIPHRTTRGKQTLFMLAPLQRSEQPPSIEMIDAVDSETGLYSPNMMQYMAKRDVQGCRRYKRRLAVTLFRLSFDKGASVPPSEEVQKEAFAAFGRMLSVSVRACDSAYRTGDGEILLFMPEASQGGAQSVTSRLNDNMRKLASMECLELAAAKLQDATVNFFGEEIESVDQVVSEVYEEMKRSGSE